MKHILNFDNSIIYAIIDNTNNETYYGSTTNSLNSRMSQHKGQCKAYLDGKNVSYCTSFKIIENKNYTTSIVEKVKCNSKLELLKREAYYIQNNICVNRCLKQSVGGSLKIELTDNILMLYKDTFNNNIELQNHINFLKLFKTDKYITDNLKNDLICFKISLIREVEKMLKMEFMDVTFNSCQLNVIFDEKLFNTIKNTFQTKKQMPQTIKEYKYLYVMMLKNITDINFIESSRIKKRKATNFQEYVFSINEDIIEYHISIDKVKRNYDKDIIKKYNIIENMNDNNDIKTLILKDIEYLERKLTEANDRLKQFI
jgi:predicted GIY-YIG superfamily endonuclease